MPKNNRRNSSEGQGFLELNIQSAEKQGITSVNVVTVGINLNQFEAIDENKVSIPWLITKLNAMKKAGLTLNPKADKVYDNSQKF